MIRKLPLIISLAINIPLGLILTITAYGGIIPPSTSVVPSILAMTFPIFLVLTVILLIVNLFINRKAAAINALSLLICGGPILTYCPMNFFRSLDSPDDESRTFTLLSYNVMNLYDYSLEEKGEKGVYSGAALRFILAGGADIVALQECACYQLDATEKLHPELLDSIWMKYPYRECNNGGMALLSRYPVKPVEINIPSFKTYGAAYEIDIEGTPTCLINLHLQSIGLTQDDKELYMELTKGDARTKKELKEVRNDLLWKLGHAFREREIQADTIRSIVSDIKGNVIVCGDFNDIPDSYSVRTICGDDMESAYSQAGIGPGISYHANRFYFRIDHCLYRGDIEAIKSDVLHNESSDHYPLMTTFKLL